MIPKELTDLTRAAQLNLFLGKYDRAIAAEGRSALAALRRLVPGAIELVYDNYNALVIGFGPSERPSEAIFSIALYSDHVTLCFLQGVDLDDADGLLRGSGRLVRHLRLTGTKGLADQRVKKLVRLAARTALETVPKGQKRRLIVRSVSAKQRPRCPNPARPSK